MTKSWEPQVIADNSGQWSGNALRFADKQDALDWVLGLSMRWFAVIETRVIESADEPNRAKGGAA